MRIHTMIPENLYTMKDIAKIIKNPRKIFLLFQEKVRNPISELSDSSSKDKKTNVTENNPITNSKDVENTYSIKGKEYEEEYFNDKSSKPIDDPVTDLQSLKCFR